MIHDSDLRYTRTPGQVIGKICEIWTIPGNIQGQAEQSSEQPGLVVNVPVNCRKVGLDDL